MLGLIAKKIGMTQVFMEDGKLIPVTVLQVGPCFVTQKKEDYGALQIGFDEKRPKSVKKPQKDMYKKINVTPKKILREFRMDKKELDAYQVGQEITMENLFKTGDFIDVAGLTKGRGFTGVMKRHNFHGADAAHGTHEYKRHGGSIGQHTQPGRTFKGVKMPGRYGNTRVTTQNIKITQIIKDNNLMLIHGSTPGPNGGYIIINKAVKKIKV